MLITIIPPRTGSPFSISNAPILNSAVPWWRFLVIAVQFSGLGLKPRIRHPMRF